MRTTVGTTSINISPKEKKGMPAITTSSPMLCVIGSSSDCNYIIHRQQDPGVSRHHCVIDCNPPELNIKDLGSKNGTYVNGKDIRESGEPTALANGDTIQVCNTIFTIGIDIQVAESEKPLYCIRCGDPLPWTREQCMMEGDYLCGVCREESTAVINMNDGPEDVAAKDLISGYRIIRGLGRGALGQVYLAQKRGSVTQLALKLMLPNVAVHENNRTRFLREVEALQALQHPNIIRTFDSGYDKGIFYIALEYCNSGNLEDYILANGPIEIPQAVELVISLLDALEYAHNSSIGELTCIVHRDVKPGNVLLHESSYGTTAKLADFGLCKAFNGSGLCSFTQTGAVAGTFAFMCRQQLLDYRDSQPEVDVWGAIGILYYMLTGYTPRTGNSFTSILDHKPIPIQERDPSIPTSLAKLIDAGMNDHKKKLKYQSAADFKAALLKCSSKIKL